MKTKLNCNCCGSKRTTSKLVKIGANIRVKIVCKDCGKVIAITE